MSSSNTAKLNIASPLSFMQKLSLAVYLYRPLDESAVSIKSAARPKEIDVHPRLVLLLGWMDARDVHLARCVCKYRALYPSTSILLVKSRVAGTIWSSIGAGDTKPAVEAMQAILTEDFLFSQDSTRPRLFIHALSGGGSSSLYYLFNHFARRNLYIPKHVAIFDSLPGTWRYQFNIGVMTAPIKPGWRRLLVLPIAHLVAIICWVLIRIMGMPDPQKTWSMAHNDKRKNHEVRRVYIYSEADKICLSIAVENHVAEAKTRGFVVRLERFEGSGHVAHMRTDAARYWRVVEATWDNASSL